MNPYEILEIKNNSSKEEIRKAYLKMVKKYHPDNLKTGDIEKFLIIQKAFDILGEGYIKFSQQDFKSTNFSKEETRYIIRRMNVQVVIILSTIFSFFLSMLLIINMDNLDKNIKYYFILEKLSAFFALFFMMIYPFIILSFSGRITNFIFKIFTGNNIMKIKK